MALTKKYEDLKREAAEKRKIQPTNQWTKQQNKEKHLRIIKWVSEVNSARQNIGS